MGKIHILIFMSLLSFKAGSTQGADGNGWYTTTEMMYETARVATVRVFDLRARLYYSEGVALDFIASESATRAKVGLCERFKDSDIGINYVNGKAIKFTTVCNGGEIVITPKYQNDVKYLIDELLTKEVVQVGSITIPTIGFMESYGELRSFMNLIK